jgi:hypothetical protein
MAAPEHVILNAVAAKSKDPYPTNSICHQEEFPWILSCETA